MHSPDAAPLTESISLTDESPGTDAPAFSPDPLVAALIREQEQSQTRLSLIKWLITLRDAAKDHPLILALIVGAAIVAAGAGSWCVKAYLAADDTGARQAGDATGARP